MNRPRLAAARFIGIGLTVLALAGCTQGTGGEQSLVDRAALTVQDMMTQNVSQDPKSLLRRAKGAMICPQVFKAGFFVGGEGGSCVLLARSGNGTWSYPTFYDIGSGSFGFQFGVQDSQLILLVMTTKGLNAVMDSQVRLGGNVSVAVASVGGGVQGSTTTAAGADIIAFAEARGLFGGVSLEGGIMAARIDKNKAYYGQPLAARQIVLQMQGANPGADPLRLVLTRYGAPDSATPPPAYQVPLNQPGPQEPPTFQPPSAQPSYPPAYQPPQAPPSYQQPGGTQPPPAYLPPGASPPNQPPPQQAYPPGPQAPPSYQPPPAEPSYPPPQAATPYQPPPAQPAYQPPPAPRTNPPSYQQAPPSYQPPTPPSGYQPPPGQYTYPPAAPETPGR